MSTKFSRDRLTDHVSRAWLSLQLRRATRPTLVYLAGLAVALGCCVYIISNLPGHGGLSSSRTYRFAVTDATGVVPGRDEVRFKGIPAGLITEANLVNGSAVLTISLESQYGRLYSNAQATLRPNTPLQDMYLDITDRGTPAAGVPSAAHPFPDTQTSSSVNVADVLQVLNQNTRDSLATTLSQFGGGLADHGAELRTAFVELVPFLQVAGRIADQLAIRRGQTAELIHDTRLLSTELAWRQQSLSNLVQDGGRALDTVAASSSSLNAILHQLPPTLDTLDTSFISVEHALPTIDGAIHALGPAADELPAGLAAVRALSASARPALQALQAPVRQLVPLVNAVLPVSQNLLPAVTQLVPQVPDINHVTQSIAECGFTLQRFFAWTQSTFAMGDAHGEAPRGDAALALDTPGIIAQPGVATASTCSHAHVEGGVPTPLVHP